MTRPSMVVLHGDETGEELLEEALRVLDAEVTGVEVEFVAFDLSLENRRATNMTPPRPCASAGWG